MISTQYDNLISRVELPPSILGFYVSSRAEDISERIITSPSIIYIGESDKRFGSLDLDYYRKNMSVDDVRLYLDFIGEEKVDFHLSDFETYYPDDEE